MTSETSATQGLSQRAKDRLMAAGRLMGVLPANTPYTEEICREMISRIDALPARTKENLKGLVDWIEEYGFEEADASISADIESGEDDFCDVDSMDDDAVLAAMASVRDAGLRNYL